MANIVAARPGTDQRQHRSAPIAARLAASTRPAAGELVDGTRGGEKLASMGAPPWTSSSGRPTPRRSPRGARPVAAPRTRAPARAAPRAARRRGRVTSVVGAPWAPRQHAAPPSSSAASTSRAPRSPSRGVSSAGGDGVAHLGHLGLARVGVAQPSTPSSVLLAPRDGVDVEVRHALADAVLMALKTPSASAACRHRAATRCARRKKAATGRFGEDRQTFSNIDAGGSGSGRRRAGGDRGRRRACRRRGRRARQARRGRCGRRCTPWRASPMFGPPGRAASTRGSFRGIDLRLRELGAIDPLAVPLPERDRGDHARRPGPRGRPASLPGRGGPHREPAGRRART